jgi:uncharacterized RDD family membrane protein YckC
MTAEEISRSYDASIIVRRWLGAWIDFIVLFSIFLVPGLISNDFYRRGLPLWTLLALAYFPAMETITGRTIGKYAAGTVVVDDEGNRPTIGKVLIRTVLRLIEVNPLLAGGIPAGLAVAFSKSHQRLGDMAAGTYVIKQQHLHMISAFTAQYPEDRMAPRRRAAWAVAAVYLGLCSVLVVPAPFAIVAGILGLQQTRKNPELRGRAGAVFGIIAGSLALSFLLWSFFMTGRPA